MELGGAAHHAGGNRERVEFCIPSFARNLAQARALYRLGLELGMTAEVRCTWKQTIAS